MFPYVRSLQHRGPQARQSDLCAKDVGSILYQHPVRGRPSLCMCWRTTQRALLREGVSVQFPAAARQTHGQPDHVQNQHTARFACSMSGHGHRTRSEHEPSAMACVRSRFRRVAVVSCRHCQSACGRLDPASLWRPAEWRSRCLFYLPLSGALLVYVRSTLREFRSCEMSEDGSLEMGLLEWLLYSTQGGETPWPERV